MVGCSGVCVQMRDWNLDSRAPGHTTAASPSCCVCCWPRCCSCCCTRTSTQHAQAHTHTPSRTRCWFCSCCCFLAPATAPLPPAAPPAFDAAAPVRSGARAGCFWVCCCCCCCFAPATAPLPPAVDALPLPLLAFSFMMSSRLKSWVGLGGGVGWGACLRAWRGGSCACS